MDDILIWKKNLYNLYKFEKKTTKEIQSCCLFGLCVQVIRENMNYAADMQRCPPPLADVAAVVERSSFRQHAHVSP